MTRTEMRLLYLEKGQRLANDRADRLQALVNDMMDIIKDLSGSTKAGNGNNKKRLHLKLIN